MDGHHRRENDEPIPLDELYWEMTKKIGAATFSVVAGFGVGVASYNRSFDAEVAGSFTSISPASDGYATAELGVLPDARIPIHTPFGLGATVDVGNSLTEASAVQSSEMIDALYESYGSLLVEPDIEINELRDNLSDHLRFSMLLGMLTALGVGGAIRFAGKEMSAFLSSLADKKHFTTSLGAAFLASSAVAVVATESYTPIEQVGFVPIVDKVPRAALVPELADVEIRDIALTAAGERLINGIIDSYLASEVFYTDLEQTIESHASEFHVPEEGQKVGMSLSDRHLNYLVDKSLRKIADLGGASFVMDLGDDTSSGSSSEEFSLRSLHEVFKGMKILVITGNHDAGGDVLRYWEDNDAITADDEVITFEGITFILRNDPHDSDFTPERKQGDISDQELTDDVTKTACESDERVNVIMVAKKSYASDAIAQGCADLALSGDTHVQTKPSEVLGENGATGYELTNGTSGGASYAIALGKLRRPASATLVTFEDGKPVGVQIVTLNTNGVVEVGEYTLLNPGLPAAPESAAGKADQIMKNNKEKLESGDFRR